MLRFLEKNPIIYGIIVVVIFLFWTFPPWLAAVWPLFAPDEKFPDWLVRKGWYGVSQYLSALLLAISTVSTFILLGAIFHAVREHMRRLGWLETLAEEDNINIARLVFSQNHNLPISPYLNKINPYVIFRIRIFNSSVYSLTLEEKIDGGFSFMTSPLPDQAKFYWDKKSTPKVDIKHGEHCSFALRQYLPKNVVDFIVPRGGGEFWTDNLALWFTYHDHTSVSRRVRVEIQSIVKLEIPVT